MTVTHVAIVDDHRLFREGLATILAAVPTIRVVAHGERPAEVLDSPEAAAIDVLLLDVELDGPPARTTIATVRRTRPDIRVVVLTMHRDAVLRRTLLDAGAVDFVTKDTPSRELVDRIARAAHADAAPVTFPVDLVTEARAGSPLSDRELEVLRLLAAARTNAEIAADLQLAIGTVKRHVYNVFRKLDVGSRVGAVAAATRLGLLTKRPRRRPTHPRARACRPRAARPRRRAPGAGTAPVQHRARRSRRSLRSTPRVR
ncbi:response regulator transcription factor [Curtobacterium flaccumfaciens pv. flaccumfaciens]|nr:response regulator transcription factor [Curtobacterium flaccumfaciens pv. flaccumfaciens]